MPVVGGPPGPRRPSGVDSSSSSTTSSDVERARAEAAVDRLSGGRAPSDVYESNVARLSTPSRKLGAFADELHARGYTWKADDLDFVMKKYGIGDARALLLTAVALDEGSRYPDHVLSKEELVLAGQKQAQRYREHLKFSPQVLADVMTQTGVADEGALVRAAEQVDRMHGADHELDRGELTLAAEVLQGLVGQNDVMAILDRVEAIKSKAAADPACDVEVERLGVTDGIPVEAITFPSVRRPPMLRVLVTGGVHGDEPCGAGAATLLLEQLANDPRIRQLVSFTVVPMVNPRGLAKGTRRTPEDVDLNRTFREVPDDPVEADFMQEFFERRQLDDRPFDLALDLHSGGAGRNGFWVLHKASEDLAAAALAEVGKSFPLLDRDTKPYDLVSPGVASSGSTRTLKDLAFESGAGWAMTVEAPGSVGYADQVLGENAIVHEVVRQALSKTMSSGRVAVAASPD